MSPDPESEGAVYTIRVAGWLGDLLLCAIRPRNSTRLALTSIGLKFAEADVVDVMTWLTEYDFEFEDIRELSASTT
jgi:hypothetical protein